MKWKRKNSFSFNIFIFNWKSVACLFTFSNEPFLSTKIQMETIRVRQKRMYVRAKTQKPKSRAISVFESHGKQLAI